MHFSARLFPMEELMTLEHFSFGFCSPLFISSRVFQHWMLLWELRRKNNTHKMQTMLRVRYFGAQILEQYTIVCTK